MRLALHHGIDDLEMIGLERAAGLGDFDDGVGEHGRLHFGGAPAELDLHIHAAIGKVALAHFDEFGGDDFAFEIFGFLKAAGIRERRAPSALCGGSAWRK